MKTQKKSRNGDSSIVGAVIAAICIIIYLCALVQAAVRLYLSVEQRGRTAEFEFGVIANLAESTGTRGFMDERFIETMNNALASSRSIEALIISGPEGEYAFERQRGRAVTWVNNSPRFINKFSFSSHSHYRHLQIQDLRNTNIQAVAGTFDFADFTQILKETLILILIGFALACFTMLIQSLAGKPAEKTYTRPYTPTPSYTPPAYTPPPYTPIREGAREPVRERVIEREIVETAVPKGLYSPRSNLGWEDYFTDRLESELHRCASTEKDLTLIAMEFTGNMDNIQFKQAAEEAVSFFTTRDLLFENGDQGISVLLPGVELEAGIAKSQKFHQRIMEKFPHSYKTNTSLYIGLTSRSGRLLNSGRMLMEVMEALQRAKSDRESSIIAFKSDPEKYRRFIASQNPQRF